MRKIPTLFIRDEKTHQLTPEVNPDAAWVIEGEGIPTRKYDGTPVLIKDHQAYKRIMVRKDSQPPTAWLPAQDAPDPITGEWPGWVLIGAGPEDEHFRLALSKDPGIEGTYEVIGPKVNGNPEGMAEHWLARHDERILAGVPREFEELRAYFGAVNIEGVVWHHPDGRMAKIKGKDFGIRRVKIASGVTT